MEKEMQHQIAIVEFDLSPDEKELQAALKAYKKVGEAQRLECGKRIYEWMEKNKAQGKKGKGLRAIWHKVSAGISIRTGYRIVQEYEISIGIREDEPPRVELREDQEIEDAEYEEMRPLREAQQPIWKATYAEQFAARYAIEYPPQIAAGKDDWNADHKAADIAETAAEKAADTAAPDADLYASEKQQARVTAHILAHQVILDAAEEADRPRREALKKEREAEEAAELAARSNASIRLAENSRRDVGSV